MKTKDRIRNWNEYNRSLIQRGSLTGWFSKCLPITKVLIAKFIQNSLKRYLKLLSEYLEMEHMTPSDVMKPTSSMVLPQLLLHLIGMPSSEKGRLPQ